MRPLLGIYLLAMLPFAASAAEPAPHPIPTRAALDAEVADAMKVAQANGLAIAVIDDGNVVHVAAYGKRNAQGDPLQANTVMYGASLTKTVFAWTVMQLVEEGRLDLDRPIARTSPHRSPTIPPKTGTGRGPTWPATTAGRRSLRACC